MEDVEILGVYITAPRLSARLRWVQSGMKLMTTKPHIATQECSQALSSLIPKRDLTALWVWTNSL